MLKHGYSKVHPKAVIVGVYLTVWVDGIV